RTLAPGHPGYQARCVGTQAERDLVYHQGPAWGWLRGHFEMARARAETQVLGGEEQGGGLPEMPIPGHLAELFDAEAPFTPRGAPAQAWSLACLEEHAARRRGRIDPKLSKVFAQRWLNRSERRKRREESSSAPDFLDGAELD
ncbi:MAG: amylo-alpha-1,6-glucosidase, partial [Bdellovibrionota bacterium]